MSLKKQHNGLCGRDALHRIFTMTILLCAFLLPKTAAAQETTDLGAMLSAEYQQNVFRNTDISVKEELRFDNKFSQFARSKTSLSVDYKFPRYGFKIGGGVYYINKYTKKHIYKNRYRFVVNLSYRYDYRNWKFGYRMRFQWLFHDEARGYYNYTPDFYWRNRLSVAYQRPNSRYKYSLSGEIYSLLNNDRRFDFERVALTADVSYRLTRRQYLSVFIRDDRDIMIDDDLFRIIYFGVSWKFKQ